MNRYAVIGQPVSHSLSPAIFTFLFERMGVAGEYDKRETIKKKETQRELQRGE